MTMRLFYLFVFTYLIISAPCAAEEKLVLPSKTALSADVKNKSEVTINSVTPFVSNTVSKSIDTMTWQEVRDAIQSGSTTVIIPTGGTEQNGPHIATGKHNLVLQYTVMTIADKLGNTLYTPTIPFSPAGNIHPASDHMRFAGTISLRPETFAAILEDTARSMKEHGFKTICFIGEHGASQAIQQQIAEKLSTEWKSERIRVIHVGDYYDPERNGQIAWLHQAGSKESNPEAHAGLADTAEMMSLVNSSKFALRKSLVKAYAPSDESTLGVAGSGVEATNVMGAKLLELKVTAAVKQIQEAAKK